ncbi:MAG: hypothetical protein ABI281_02220 [Caldimonas sp.]
MGPIVVAWLLLPLLLAIGPASMAQTTLQASRAPGSSALASRPMSAAPRTPRAPPGAEAAMVELQSTVGQRAMAVPMTVGMSKSINEGNKAVAGNIGRGSSAPACRKCEARAKPP